MMAIRPRQPPAPDAPAPARLPAYGWDRRDRCPAAIADGFVWGAATVAYQIEGAVDVGGRGPSVGGQDLAQPAIAAAIASLVALGGMVEAFVPLPAHTEVLCASGPLDDGLLPRDTAAWLGTGD